jgi:hypothetical protein
MPMIIPSSKICVLFQLALCQCFCKGFTRVSFFPRRHLKRSAQLRILLASAHDEEDRDHDDPTVSCASTSDSDTSAMTLVLHSGTRITESSFCGAGEPRPDLRPEELPLLLMTALRHNDFPHVDSGLQSVWAFCGDTTRHLFQHNMTDFIISAHDTANEFPTSFYGNALYGQHWEVESELNRIMGATSTTSSTFTSINGSNRDSSCWIATQVIKTISSDGRMRRWQWELRRNRRPPNLNCWYVESIGSSDRKGNFEAHD